MESYQPAWRRPIAQIFRRSAAGAVSFCVRFDVHPNSVSYASIGAAVAAAGCFWQSSRWPLLLVPAVAFCYLRLWFNMLDGMVALASGKASRSGEIANELPDRISDVLVFVGAAHSGLCHPLSGYWAAIFALLTAYVGTLGQAVGARREFSGVMSKPWRMVTLHFGAWITLAMLWWSGDNPRLARLTVLDWTHLVVVAGAIQTISVRLRRMLRSLRAVETGAANRPDLSARESSRA